MTVARWKDLCMDAGDALALAGFWGAAFGLPVRDLGDGSARVDGRQPGETVWVDPVPEPKTVKHRVHLDVEVGSLDGLLGLGARVLREPGDDRTWWVLADVEGGEFCAFVRDGQPALPARPYELVVDAADPVAQARWWADVLGAQVRSEGGNGGPGPWSWVEPVEGAPWRAIVVVPVPEPKTAKNRLHWDVETDDVAQLERRGARVLREPGGDVSWHVLADPEGNEFCAFTRGS